MSSSCHAHWVKNNEVLLLWKPAPCRRAQCGTASSSQPYFFLQLPALVQAMKPFIPEPNEWFNHFPTVPRLARQVHVALPCVGIDGSGWALKKLGANFHCNNVFDLERRYQKYLETYMESAERPRLGPNNGDVLKVKLSEWERPVQPASCRASMPALGREWQPQRYRRPTRRSLPPHCECGWVFSKMRGTAGSGVRECERHSAQAERPDRILHG